MWHKINFFQEEYCWFEFRFSFAWTDYLTKAKDLVSPTIYL